VSEMKAAFLFPGQGAQAVGMGRDLYEGFPAARAMFDRAEELTGLALKRLCFEGPEEELARTDVCQPAIFTVSAAALACLLARLGPARAEALRPAYMAGLSLGEYTALYAAGMVDFDDALRLVARRGEAMQAAAVATPSGMVSVLGVDEAQARALCEAAAEGQVLACANFNCPGQVVLSGQADACRRAERMARDFGASGAVPLKVAGAFHSELMAPAAETLAGALRDVAFRDPPGPAGAAAFASPATRVVANVDARPYAAAAEVQDRLLAQLVRPVRWQQCCELLLAEGVETFYEIGPGRVLAGLMRRIHRKAKVTCVGGVQAIEELTCGG